MSAKAWAGSVNATIPEVPNPNAYYLFYLHGSIVEQKGDRAHHPHHGVYHYSSIAERFAEMGFEVVSEVRPNGTGKGRYARKVAMEIQQLLDAGVPGRRITVAGHSKGGSITMITSTFLSNPDVGFISLAGCGTGQFARAYGKFMERSAAKLSGRMLSLYDRSDKISGTCKEAFKRAQGNRRISAAEEIVFRTGLGHGLFYKVRDDWMVEVQKWAKALER